MGPKRIVALEMLKGVREWVTLWAFLLLQFKHGVTVTVKLIMQISKDQHFTMAGIIKKQQRHPFILFLSESKRACCRTKGLAPCN